LVLGGGLPRHIAWCGVVRCPQGSGSDVAAVDAAMKAAEELAAMKL